MTTIWPKDIRFRGSLKFLGLLSMSNTPTVYIAS